MSHSLQIKAFFFNAKTDYLPYYKNFNITINDDANAKDLLVKIQELNENFSFPNKNLIMKINDLVTEGTQSIGSIIEKFGTKLQIDPVKSYRSNNGLIINDDDFMASYALLEPYATDADLKYYKTLYALHYASETENFDHAYIGDAILILAHKMISDDSKYTEEILAAISSVDSGLFDCEYENNLFNAQDHRKTIEILKTLAQPEPEPSLCSQIIARFSKKEKEEKSIPLAVSRKKITIEDIESKHIAYYPGVDSHTPLHSFMEDSCLNKISFKRSHKLSGLSILESNKNLALKKAGTILLDAYDSGAEVVVVEDSTVLDMFLKYFSEIENNMGRKMIGLKLISTKDFLAQLTEIAA